jgi:succinoglycan biosynthesis protein ExoM
MPTGAVVPLTKLRFGNVLLRASLLRAPDGAFDPRYGLTGGEDGDLLLRLANSGARLVWADEAIIYEPVETSRLRLRWLLLRALRGGQDFSRHTVAGRFGPLSRAGCMWLVLRAVVQALGAGLFALVAWPFGRHRAVYWLLKMSANVGKLTIFLGWHYREYGDQHASSL